MSIFYSMSILFLFWSCLACSIFIMMSSLSSVLSILTLMQFLLLARGSISSIERISSLERPSLWSDLFNYLTRSAYLYKSGWTLRCSLCSLMMSHWVIHYRSWRCCRNQQMSLLRPLLVCCLGKEYGIWLGPELWCTTSTIEEICWFQLRQSWSAYFDRYGLHLFSCLLDQWRIFLWRSFYHSWE